MRKLALICLVLAAGCGYSTASLHDTRYRTISVPIFGNDTFYRGFEYELTRAVIEMVEGRTNMKVVNDRNTADTILLGTLVDYGTHVLTEDPSDIETEIQVAVLMSLKWYERASGRDIMVLPAFRETAEAALPAGQTPDDARREAFTDIAERIVEQLEGGW